MPDLIAVVGMACRFPGASDVREFWHNLRAGADMIERRHTNREGFVAAYGVMPGAGLFDWRAFGYSRAEAGLVDPQQRVFLETAALALDDAALDPARFDGAIGVFGGCDPPLVREGAPETAWDKDMLATRVAYKLGLCGPAITVQSACSTSLLAVHLACRSLRDGECDVALAGGVRIGVHPEGGYRHVEGDVLSPDGYCRPFDAGACGTVPADGVGVVVLRRLEDALRERHEIVAVVRGSAVNNDGARKVGFTAPSVRGQRDVTLRALDAAGVDPAEVTYVEAHGTGTRLGDPVEVAALTEAFRARTGRAGFCGLGSVKGNIGHTGAASGVASLIKTALMLRHEEIVPSAHFERPNPDLGLDGGPFHIATERRPWPGPALAGVSSLGMGGTNVHLVLASPPARTAGTPRPGPRVLCLSAHSERSLSAYRDDLADRLGAADAPSLLDTAHTLSLGRRELALRRAVVAKTPEEAVRELARETTPLRARDGRRVALLFPGQGGLRTGGAAEALRVCLPAVREADSRARTVLAKRLGLDPDVLDRDSDDTLAQQVNLFTLGYGVARQLMDWGLRPVAALGSSLGEYTAVAAAGLWTFEDALVLVAERATAMRACPPGRMLAVDLPLDRVAEAAPRHSGLSVAVEDVGRTILSGPRERVERLRAELTAAGVAHTPLRTGHAFHSPAMRGAADALSRAVAGTPVRGDLAFPVLSNLTGEPLDAKTVADPGYWVEQLCGTVRMRACVSSLLSGPAELFAELGVGTATLASLRRHPLWNAELAAVALPGRHGTDRTGVLDALDALWAYGAPVNWEDVDDAGAWRRRSLPAPPFDPVTPDETAVHRPNTTSRTPLEDLWRDALGVDAVSPEDDFFRLGGESLGLVRLAAAVRERLGVEIPVGVLVERPTFGHLLDLAGRSPGDGPTLSSDPIFLVPPASGSSLAYRPLAGALTGRTCHAFDTPGLVPGTHHPGTVEALAADHVRQLRRVRPDGRPVVLLGWSMGAVVAHEMARQLTGDGDPVALLVCVDGHPPPGPGLPVGAHPRHLADALSHLRHLRRSLRRPDRSATGAGRHLAGLVEASGDGFDLAGVYRRNLRALLRHRPRPVPCPAVVLRAGASPRRLRWLELWLSSLYPAGVRVRPIPGDHWSVLTDEGAAAIAREIQDVLPPATRDER
ncbi:type I polyketide synthase [Streptosporangium saharense]|uniref:Phthiocerol/phenolphthiocerol synthesis type-I polyketide synthase E n=1 Tax=Streptosporangium saharense TaxID=1706840 RepID=A0A7W7QKT9_9ACTN|nr:type I polyketide synthase [Streptosporangium saharense]MBB4915426.1 phthiocerol/phenolphthiocerol synthesis type-I polyketide synthase E [Streptosporangium saharense]